MTLVFTLYLLKFLFTPLMNPEMVAFCAILQFNLKVNELLATSAAIAIKWSSNWLATLFLVLEIQHSFVVLSELQILFYFLIYKKAMIIIEIEFSLFKSYFISKLFKRSAGLFNLFGMLIRSFFLSLFILCVLLSCLH